MGTRGIIANPTETKLSSTIPSWLPEIPLPFLNHLPDL